MKNLKPLKKLTTAFTMIELIFVIVVLGILSSIALPNLENDHSQEAADNILSHIRYTQHLALTDSKHLSNNSQWQQRFWRIVFSTCTGNDRYFMIGSDDNMESANNAVFDRNESAIDPQNGKPYYWRSGMNCSEGGDGSVSEDIFISKKYGIIDVRSSDGCGTGQTRGHIGFDNLGRPHYGFSNSIQPNYAKVITQACTFEFTMSNNEIFSISIQPETGYAQIVGQPDS
jgi:prepilin-type N-terminal cleavage/methylation domain-containing protein